MPSSKNDDFELIHDTFIEPRLTIREGVIRTLQKQLDPNLFRPDSTSNHEDDEYLSDDKHIVQNLQSQGFFSLIDISNALAMSKEEKTMSWVLIELRKVHKNIGEKANRYGRRFQYTYHLTDITSKIKTPKQTMSEEKISPKLENPVKLRVEIN